jgi:hypothetical protein
MYVFIFNILKDLIIEQIQNIEGDIITKISGANPEE